MNRAMLAIVLLFAVLFDGTYQDQVTVHTDAPLTLASYRKMSPQSTEKMVLEAWKVLHTDTTIDVNVRTVLISLYDRYTLLNSLENCVHVHHSIPKSAVVTNTTKF
ncbi:unnamed protein product [Caenorhabditis auriculariae]|uniref:Uncharacterized protein n=1 Tax=Caenorhabditis auriculariae TaxID=2777116 RepID=A0A8S1HI80_9PELO|nr:unnamed protein product [Caenorhabditis auriculariae]